MIIFLLYCAASGLLLGATGTSVLLLILTSVQIMAAPAFLWVAEMIGADSMLVWMLFGLFTHQLAFLTGAYLPLWLERPALPPPQKADEATLDPDQAVADLSAAAARMRTALIGQTRRNRAAAADKHAIRSR